MRRGRYSPPGRPQRRIQFQSLSTCHIGEIRVKVRVSRGCIARTCRKHEKQFLSLTDREIKLNSAVCAKARRSWSERHATISDKRSVGGPERNKLFGKPRRRWEDMPNIKQRALVNTGMNLRVLFYSIELIIFTQDWVSSVYVSRSDPPRKVSPGFLYRLLKFS